MFRLITPILSVLVIPLFVTVHAGAAEAAEKTKKVFVIGVDGLQPDSMVKAPTPNLDRLILQGAYSLRGQSEDLTFSGPNWSSILHGVHRDKHRVTTNGYEGNVLEQFPDYLTYLEKHDPNFVTARLVTWDQIQLKQPSEADLKIYRDYSKGGDERVTDETVQLFRGDHPEQPGDVDAVFTYLGSVDTAGHTYGFHPESEDYLKAIARADEQIGRMVAAMQSRKTYDQENWLIIVTTDHGGSLDKGHAGNTPERRTIPFIVSGPSAANVELQPPPRNVDVAATALTHMGLEIKPEWNLDSRPRGLKGLEQPLPEPKLGENLLFNGDAEFDRGFDQPELDQAITGWDDAGPQMMTVTRYDRGEATPGFPTAPAEGSNGGKNFFSGGTRPVSRITQRVDVSRFAAAIDAGKAKLKLAALLGGYANQEDCAVVTARCYGHDGLGTQIMNIGPVTAAERNGATTLIPKEYTGAVVPGTRTVEVEVLCLRHSGTANDGYADNVSLVLTASE